MLLLHNLFMESIYEISCPVFSLSEDYMWCPTLVGEENKPPLIRVWKPSPSRRVLKPWGKPERESPKRTISASGGPGSLQMVSELDTGRCASLLAVPRRGVDTRRCASKDAGPQRGVDLRVVPHQLEEG